jgi:DNA-binding winged helix-turn-helix (wHTH) protein
LVAEKKMIKLPKQQFDILLMFFVSDEYTIDKNELMEKFWSKSSRAKESMVSAINKLRNYLKEAGCTFNIITKKGGDCYILEYVGENVEVYEVAAL